MDTYQRFEPDPSGEETRLPASAGTCGDCFSSGHGSPEGVVTGDFLNEPYLDLDDGSLWLFAGTVGAKTGWV